MTTPKVARGAIPKDGSRLTAAREHVAAGLSLIPIGEKSKTTPPGIAWKVYQRRRPTDAELRVWVGRYPGLGIVGGKVSGKDGAALEILDIEAVAKASIKLFCQLVEEVAPGLLDRLPRVKTPTEGCHIYYRCKIVEGNQKLAQRAEEVTAGDLPRTNDGAVDKDAVKKLGLREIDGRYFKIRTLIETRGEGGQVLSPLCLPGTHPNGGVYELTNGDLRDIPTITTEEREMLLNAARACNEFVEPAKAKGAREAEREKVEGVRPGADYNARSDAFEKSRALLDEFGWTPFRSDSLGELWSRPGVGDHCSARLFNDGALHIFSTNASPFDAGETYSPFALYTELKHGSGNYSAAAKALAAAGYGDRRKSSKAKTDSKSDQPPADEEEGKSAAGNADDEETSGCASIPDLELFEGKLRLRFKCLPRGKVSVEVESEGALVHQDQVYLSRDAHRVRFLKKVAKFVELTEERQGELEKEILLKSREVEAFVEEERKEPARKPVGPDGEYIPYKVEDGKLIWMKPITGSGEMDGLYQPVTLTNFTATITGDVIRDDGTEPVHIFEVEVNVIGNGGSRKGTVKEAELSAMRWPVAVGGGRAVIYAGKIEHARAAVQLLSDKIKVRHVVAHTGWRKEAEGWRFYHAGGAIGAEGLIPADVELPPALAPCDLPAPPTGDRLREVVREVTLELPKVAPERISLPLTGAVFVAVLTGGDFSLFLLGTTGKGKTELAILAQSFFGAGFDEKHIPADWKDTAYSIQEIAHLAKDVVCIVDDFVPKGTQIEQAKLHAKAEIVLRGQANSSGRARCNPDGSVRPKRPPRGLVVATGEDIPRGQSLVARMLATEVEEGDVDFAQLTLCQEQRRTGVYAEALGAFLQWLATDNRIERLQKEAAEKTHELRAAWLEKGVDAHKKVATTLAQLQRAWGAWLDFAVECGAIDAEQQEAIREKVKDALNTAGCGQARFLANENPATRFVELLKAAIRSGRAHIAAAADDLTPPDPGVWGWQEKIFQVRGQVISEWEPNGDKIGWIQADDVYLQPDAAYKMAQSMGVNGEGLTVASATLWKRLKEERLLSSTDEKRETNKIRKTINGKSETVIHISAKLFFPADTPR